MTIKRMLVTQDDLIQVGQSLRRDSIYYVSGSNSIYCQTFGIKYINERATRPWPNEDGEIIDMLPGEAARTELSLEFPDLKRVGWSPGMIKLFDKQVPMHYAGPYEGPAVMLDLVGAYHQIYRLMWLDVSYPGGYYGKYPLLDVGDRLKDWKAARNAVVGIARMRHTVGVRGKRRHTLRVTNPYLSPCLWATIQDTLHWIASVAIGFGCVYVNTDGYIFPLGKDAHHYQFENWLRRNGFTISTRAIGEAELKNWNNYKVGSYRTKPYRLKLSGLNHKGSSNVEKPRFTEWEIYYRRLRNIIRVTGRAGGRGQECPDGLREANPGDGGLQPGAGRSANLRSGYDQGRPNVNQGRIPGVFESTEEGDKISYE